MSTVTDFKANISKPTLDGTLKDFEQWRATKTNPATPIPDALWSKLFDLANQYSPATVKRLFGISAKQYNAKLQEFQSKQRDSAQTTQHKPISQPNIKNKELISKGNGHSNELCQINIKKKESPYELAPLPSAKTVIVEFCRSDGKIMKIHTTQDSITNLINTFFGEQ